MASQNEIRPSASRDDNRESTPLSFDGGLHSASRYNRYHTPLGSADSFTTRSEAVISPMQEGVNYSSVKRLEERVEDLEQQVEQLKTLIVDYILSSKEPPTRGDEQNYPATPQRDYNQPSSPACRASNIPLPSGYSFPTSAQEQIINPVTPSLSAPHNPFQPSVLPVTPNNYPPQNTPGPNPFLYPTPGQPQETCEQPRQETDVPPTGALPTLLFMAARDIPRLEWENMSGPGAAGRVRKFISDIEDCAATDEERVRVALNRMDAAAMLVIRQKTSKNATWAEMRKCLYYNEGTFSESLDHLSQQEYDLKEHPRQFIHRFTYLYESMRLDYPDEEVQPLDQMIKKRLCKSLDERLLRILESQSHEKMSLDSFVNKFDELRKRELVGREMSNRVLAVNPPNPITAANKDPALNKLQQMQEELLQQLMKMSQQARTYCAYCRNDGHNLVDCTKKPARGLCFDCHRPKCRRGAPGCLGRPSENNA